MQLRSSIYLVSLDLAIPALQMTNKLHDQVMLSPYPQNFKDITSENCYTGTHFTIHISDLKLKFLVLSPLSLNKRKVTAS